MVCLIGIYGTCLVRLWPLLRRRAAVPDPWLQYFARMVIASLIGFLTSAQFVTVDGIELPYYVALIGAGTLRLATSPAVAPSAAALGCALPPAHRGPPPALCPPA